MADILQSTATHDITATRPLPGMQSLDMTTWLDRDDAFAEQMAERTRLITESRDAVIALLPEGQAAADDLLGFVLDWLGQNTVDYTVGAETVRRPDGVTVPIRRDDPLWTLGHLVQEDFCLLDKLGDEHVLVGAVVCFPASWALSEKVGRPLSAIHVPVPAYTDRIARQVQRAFDGVRVGRPFWRFNVLRYADADLFQPERRPQSDDKDLCPYTRTERQCILRLPLTEACVFSIHTYVLSAEQAQGS